MGNKKMSIAIWINIFIFLFKNRKIYSIFRELFLYFSLQKYWIEVVAVLGQPMCMYNVFMLSSFHSFFLFILQRYSESYIIENYMLKIDNFNYSWL